jgi:hypothetical protein
MNMLEIKGTRKEIFKLLKDNPNQTQANLLIKPSKVVFITILDQTQINKIYLTRGIYKTISKKVVDAAKHAGIEFIIQKTKAGRPYKFDKKTKTQVVSLLKRGKTAAKISAELGIPITSIYYWKRTRLKKPSFSHIPDTT